MSILPPPNDTSFRLELETWFLRAADEKDVIASAAQGLSVLAAAFDMGLPELPDEYANSLINSICSAGQPLMAATRGWLSSEQVLLGMMGAIGIARALRSARAPTQEDDAATRDSLDHALLLAFELAAVLRRQAIKARGDVLVRHLAVQRASAADAASMLLH